MAQSMSAKGQTRQFAPLRATSGLPQSTDITRPARLVRFVPRTEIAPGLFDHWETGLNNALGCDTPVDVIYRYPHVYWSNVAPQIQVAIRYLNVRGWIANLLHQRFLQLRFD